jgi:geranylgeranyl reductase family protein
MSVDADAIVVGAGPAGSSAAYHLARCGRRVLLLERRRFPRDKSCGDGLTRSAVRLLAAMGALPRLDGARRIRGSRVFMRGQGHRDFLYPPGLGDPDYGLVLPRLQLDRAICECAVEAGAELREECNVQAFVPGDRVPALEVSCRGGVQRLKAPVIVAADGAASRLAFQAGLAHGISETLGFAIRGYYSGIDGLEDLLEIYMPLMDPTDRFILPSYGWVFPTGDGAANIGVGVFERGHGVSVRKLMEHFLEGLRQTGSRFQGMTPQGRWLGAPLNFAFRPDRCYGPGILLAGDAAGLISPFTGEGIGYALESGRIAAEVIHRNLRDNAISPDLSDYALMLEKRFLGYFETGRQSARRYLLFWHVLESTFHNEKPLFALCRKAALYPEGVGESSPSLILDDVSPLIDRGGLRVREDLLAVGELLIDAVRRDWPFLAQLSASGQGDPGVPFRPALLLLLAAALKPLRVDREALYRAACAVELGYLSALAHLSVDEEARPALPQLDGDRPANWGNMLAVMVGDFLLSKAHECGAQIGSAVTLDISTAMALVAEGRVREQRNAFRHDLSDDEYLETMTLKMATLFELPCHLGARFSEFTSQEEDGIREYGRSLGLAFTIADHVLEWTGKPSELGKLMRCDPGQGVYSRPVYRSLQSGGSTTPAAAVLADTLEEARRYARLAKQALAIFDSGPAARTLSRLADYAVERSPLVAPDLRALID